MIPSRATIDQLFTDEHLKFLGIVDLNIESDAASFRSWIDEGLHGDMGFMENHIEVRCSPKLLHSGSKSALVFCLPYGFPLESKHKSASVAQYACYRDYHKTLRSRGRAVGSRLSDLVTGAFDFRVFVDSAPLLERALAAKSLEGFIGKNTLFIHPTLGSEVLLGVILSNIEFDVDRKIPVDPKIRDRVVGGCGSCKRCQVYCPTGALDQDYRLDARLCLAYWTIEHRGIVPFKFWPFFKEFFFGCDRCQTVCPYNRPVHYPKIHGPYRLDQSFNPRVKDIDLERVAHMTQAEYEEWFGGTPLTRAKRTGLRRNAIISLCVSRHPRIDMILKLAKTSDDTVIRGTALQAEEWFVSNWAKGPVPSDEF